MGLLASFLFPVRSSGQEGIVSHLCTDLAPKKKIEVPTLLVLTLKVSPLFGICNCEWRVSVLLIRR